MRAVHAERIARCLKRPLPYTPRRADDREWGRSFSEVFEALFGCHAYYILFWEVSVYQAPILTYLG
eukprot:6193804-Pleurochrysis_carterae.AAC.1